MGDGMKRAFAATKATRARTYTVTGEITISVHTEVRATSAAAAKKIAKGRTVMGLCHQCACDGEEVREEWRTSGELDGEPCNLRVEDEGE